MMSYCRGRISEGLDFKYNAARLVIIVGVPNLSLKSPNVILKQLYLGKFAQQVEILKRKENETCIICDEEVDFT